MSFSNRTGAGKSSIMTGPVTSFNLERRAVLTLNLKPCIAWSSFRRAQSLLTVLIYPRLALQTSEKPLQLFHKIRCVIFFSHIILVCNVLICPLASM